MMTSRDVERTPPASNPLQEGHVPGRVGYLLRMYPRFSQTFVVNEILELERQLAETDGQNGVDRCGRIEILSLRLPNEGVFHESVTRVKARASYLPETFLGHSRKHLAMQWGLLTRSTSAYRKAVKTILQHRGAGWFELMQAGHVIRWARKRKINHLHVHFGTDEATVALLAFLLGGPTYSLTLHAFDIFRNTVDRRLLACKINLSRFTVTVCESNRRYLINNLPGVKADRVRVNYNGIDLTRFKAPATQREECSIFSVGRLIEKKGFIHLIRAVGLLREEGWPVTCQIAGEGRERKALIREIETTGLASHVHLLGPVRQEEVRRLMQRSTCLVLPCVQAKDGNVDALPTVLLESMACGCPTISTRISGVPEIIEDGVSGLLVEPGQPQALADALGRILRDRSLAQTLGIEGRRRAEERFCVTQNVAVLHRWLQEASALRAKGCNRRGRPRGLKSAARVARSPRETVSLKEVHEAYLC